MPRYHSAPPPNSPSTLMPNANLGERRGVETLWKEKGGGIVCDIWGLQTRVEVRKRGMRGVVRGGAARDKGI